MDNDKEIVKTMLHFGITDLAHDDAEAVAEAIDLELLDKQTHPRLRKPMLEKYFAAIRRIAEFTARTGCEISAGQITYRTRCRKYLKEEREGAIAESDHKRRCASIFRTIYGPPCIYPFRTTGSYSAHLNEKNMTVCAISTMPKVTYHQAKIKGNGPYRVGLKTEKEAGFMLKAWLNTR